MDPQGRIRWQFPRPGDLARGQTFRVPDDAFFSPDGKDIIATEEDDSVISVISIADAPDHLPVRHARGCPGSSANHVSNPDDAMLLPGGDMLSADIKNCRILLVRPPAHRPARIIGHDRQRLLARPAPAVRQPQRRVPDDQRQVPGHRDQRGLGERGQPVRPRLLVGQSAGGQLPVGHQRGLPRPLPDRGLLEPRARWWSSPRPGSCGGVSAGWTTRPWPCPCPTGTSWSTTTTTTGSS